jgi:4'-phosphopantetheinyl transferase
MDSLRCLASEALLRHAAKEVLDLDPEGLATAQGAYGKPAFVDHPHLHFNLSHSGQWILCSLHDGPVGVDVEQESSRGHRAEEAFMSEEELHRHQQLPGEERLADFFRLWTLKESLLKAAGTGLSHDPRSITIGQDALPLAGAPPAPPGKSWVLEPLPMPPGAWAALCFALDRGA